MNNRWLDYFLKRALLTSSMSRDPSTKVGAVLVNQALKQEISSGYNGFPRKTIDQPSYYEDRTIKYPRIVHAEANAIAAAARLGIHTDGCWLFCTHMPCSQCAGLVINAGIIKVITILDAHTGNNDAWCFDHSARLFQEASIPVLKHQIGV